MTTPSNTPVSTGPEPYIVVSSDTHVHGEGEEVPCQRLTNESKYRRTQADQTARPSIST